MRAIVVGAGLAGLAAADALAAAGHEVSVLEARDRVGGRAWSRRLENGALVEMGAEFLLPGNTVIRELAARLGLGLWDTGMRYGTREPRGVDELPAEALEEAVAAMDAALSADPEAGRVPARRFLDGLEIHDAARQVILARLEVSCADSADVVLAESLMGVAHFDDEPAPSVAGGNQGLATGLAAGLGDAVRLGAAVRRVAWAEDGVTVGGPWGELSADSCVVAVPATTIAEISFEPALPEALGAALREIPYGQAAKLFVPLREPPEPSAVLSVPERYWAWTATGEGDLPQPVLSAFAGSPGALERLEVAAGPERWLASLRELRPDLELDEEGAVLSTWSDDPWARAAYSSALSAAATEILRGAYGPLRFAGEHTAGEFSGLMEGALRSGRRAARGLGPRGTRAPG